MKKILAALLLSLSLSPAFAVDMAALNKTIDATNFLVDSGCSGTLVNAEKGFILTAHHCIETQYRTIKREKIDDDGKVTEEKVRVTIPGTASQKFYKNAREYQSNHYIYRVVASDRALDLALIQIDSKLTGPAAVIACQPPKRGDTVYAVGNPFGVLYASITKGIVSSTNRSYAPLGISDQNDERLVQISPGIVGGNSGGAVYNEQGHLVGVPVRGSRVNEILGFSVPLEDITAFLAKHAATDLCVSGE